jgi:uncharacterized membrane protein YkvA (DUF1232 family)
VSVWAWALVAAGAVALAWAGLVVGLLVAGRHTHARALAGLVPDCAVLFARLARDPRVRRRDRAALGLLVAYLATPIDLIPDLLPVIGQLDDAILAALVLRAVLRGAGPDVVREHWPGPEPSLRALLRAAGAPAPAVP